LLSSILMGVGYKISTGYAVSAAERSVTVELREKQHAAVEYLRQLIESYDGDYYLEQTIPDLEELLSMLE